MPLCDETLLALVDELDRILDRDDVIRACTIDQVDERAERRRLSRARGPGHEDESLRQVAKALHLLRDAHLLDGYYCRGDGAKYRARSLAFPECVAAEAGDAWNLVREVGVVDLLELGAVLLEHHRVQHHVDVVRGEDGLARNRGDLATGAQQRRRTGTQMQVRRVAAHKRPEKGLDLVERTVAGCGRLAWFHNRGFESRSLDAWGGRSRLRNRRRRSGLDRGRL